MADYASNSFMYNGTRYTLLAALYTLVGGKRERSCTLDVMSLERFEYTNELNDFLLHGSITYTDKYGSVDQFIEEQFAYCEVSLIENEEQIDGGVTITKLSDTNRLVHIFLVDSIEILSRTKSIVSYQINLVSAKWLNCALHLAYSNYDKGPQEIFQILKACMQMAGVQPHADSFDKIKSNVSLSYITNEDDCLFSIFQYLMRRLYFLEDRDDSLKFLAYDEQDDSHRLIDLKDSSSNTGESELIVSFFKTSSEHMAQSEPINFGVVTKVPRSHFLPSLFSEDRYSYDFDSNAIDETVFDDTVNSGYLSNKYDMPKTKPKYSKMVQMQNSSFQHPSSVWHSHLDTYHDFQDGLFNGNALVVNAAGELTRKPGSIVTVAVDRSAKDLNGDKTEDLENLKTRYKAFEGPWIASKVRHIVEPNKGPDGNGSYRQNIVLFRNFLSEVQQEIEE